MEGSIFENSGLRRIARELVHIVRRMRARLSRRSEGFASSEPLSRSGFDRGTPVDRYYIERFLAAHAEDIRGRVLEVGEDLYSGKFGKGRIDRQDTLHIDSSNAAATIVGDLGQPGLLPPRSFDCIILTQTLQYVFDLPAALKQIRSSLRPGGVLLVTVPAIAPITPDDWQNSFYWRFTEASLKRLLMEVFDPAKVETSPLGNFYAAIAFLRGAAVQELEERQLQAVMPEFAIVVAARATA